MTVRGLALLAAACLVFLLQVSWVLPPDGTKLYSGTSKMLVDEGMH